MPRQRYHVEARDVPPIAAARILGMTLERFEEKLPELLARKFPPADQTTGNFDTKAITAWQDARYPQLLGNQSSQGLLSISPNDIRERIRAVSREAARK